MVGSRCDKFLFKLHQVKVLRLVAGYMTTLNSGNLPGWRWAGIKQLALVGSSSSLHSEACKALGGSDGVVHSRISGSGGCVRAAANIPMIIKKQLGVVVVNSHQRSLPTTQASCPVTFQRGQFCLLCCQPEPVPASLSTVTSQPTSGRRCGRQN